MFQKRYLATAKGGKMDAATLSSTVVAALSPVVAAGATEIAKTAFKDAYAVLKERLKKKPEGEQAIEKFEANPAEGKDDLQKQLTQLIETETDLAHLLQEALENYNQGSRAPLVGKVEAQKAVIADKIDTVNM
jgi:hypothetical protein